MESPAKQIIMSTVRIIADKADGQWTGTGFVYQHERNGKRRAFLVTNKHIVEGALSGEMIFHEGKIVNGKIAALPGRGFSIPFSQHDFWGNQDEKIDIAVMNISTFIEENLETFYTMQITDKIRPTANDIENLISPMDEIVFVGYPIGLWDEKNLLPIIRKGITATPYYIDFNGEPKFLIDASVFPGSSGSPVFIYHSGTFLDNNGELQLGNRIFFVGIIAKYFHKDEEGKLIAREIPSVIKTFALVEQAVDIGVVYNDTAVVATMDDIVDRILEPIDIAMKTSLAESK